jgi:hypothetical protein
MKRFLLSLIALSAAVLSGCVVAPAGYYRPHAFVIAPAPVVVVHPYYR